LELLNQMKNEFLYFYPVDLRVSGKDLLANHLTFSLYNHTAIWPDQNDKWPQAIRVNGHLMLNAEKMSKSTGNFMTLEAALNEYGSDATRFTLAEAGDGIEDANFDASVANATILKLYTLYHWIDDIMKNRIPLDTFRSNLWIDEVFLNECRIHVGRAENAYSR
jgi:leucyl-tRNA synthetase